MSSTDYYTERLQSQRHEEARLRVELAELIEAVEWVFADFDGCKKHRGAGWL